MDGPLNRDKADADARRHVGCACPTFEAKFSVGVLELACAASHCVFAFKGHAAVRLGSAGAQRRQPELIATFVFKRVGCLQFPGHQISRLVVAPTAHLAHMRHPAFASGPHLEDGGTCRLHEGDIGIGLVAVDVQWFRTRPPTFGLR
jgi:hypothetical protein